MKALKKSAFSITLTVLTAMFLITQISITQVSADNTMKVYVDPPEIIDETLVIGSTFTINITIANAHDVGGVQFTTTWNSTILECLSIVLPAGHFMDPSGAEEAEGNLWVIQKKKGVGYANYAVTYYTMADAIARGTAPRSGNGTLATLTMNVTSIGETYLQLKDVTVGNVDGDPLTCNTEDGYFCNQALPPPPPPAEIYVYPPKIVDSLLTPCNNFTVDIEILNATNVYAFNFTLTFNSTILNASNATLGDFFPPTAVTTEQIDNTIGYVKFSASLEPPESPKSGEGTLATITFHVEDLGFSALTLVDTELTDQSGSPLEHTVSSSYFNNILVTKLYVNPPEIIDPTLLPPSTFEINVTVDDVEDLQHLEFTLTYNTAVLTCYGVILNEDLNGIHPSGTVKFNDEEGYIWVNVTYDTPATPITTYTPWALITLKFQVNSLGWSILGLENTVLLDSNGDTITCETEDGFFMTLIRDVAVINVVASESDIYPRWLVEINVTAENQGDIPESFNVSALYADNLIATVNITNLMPGENITITIIWDTTDVAPCANYTITAQASPVPYEIDLLDNTFDDGGVRVRILGDVNGDEAVNILDCIAASTSFGSIPSDPNWNRFCDLNNDGKVNILDMILISSSFGERC